MTAATTGTAATATPRDAAALMADLVELVQLEALETNLFRGARAPVGGGRVFGGQVISQALMAACRTVDAERPPHSLHGYFMRPGDSSKPIVYAVEQDRDGGSFSSRRVVAIQDGKPILNLAASFHAPEDGRSFQMTMPQVPDPEELLDEQDLAMRSIDEVLAARRPSVLRQRAFTFRPTQADTRLSGAPQPPSQSYWFRSAGPLPDGMILHRVLLAYASDMMLLATALLPHGLHWLKDPMQEASLDHALWIHDDLRLDDWLLYVQDSPWSGGARGIGRGLIYSRDGRLVASVVQEGLIRIARPGA